MSDRRRSPLPPTARTTHPPRERTCATAWALVVLALSGACRGPRGDVDARRELQARRDVAQAAELRRQEPDCLRPRRDPVAPEEPFAHLLPVEVDRARAVLERGLKIGARWIDSFLGDERALAEENDTWGRLRLDTTLEDRAGLDAGASVGGRLVLPGTERRLNLVFSGAEDETSTLDLLADDPAAGEFAGGAANNDAERAEAALQYFLRATQRNNLRLESGVTLSDGEVDPYGGARWRHSVALAAWTLRLSERARVYVERGWDSQTRLDLERPVSRALFFRATSRGDVGEEEQGWRLAQNLALFQRLSSRRLLTYELGGEFLTEPDAQLEQAYVRLRYSQRLAREWIRLELTPQLAWREEYDYQVVGGLLVRLDLEVGRSY